jgi:hypothetical protein
MEHSEGTKATEEVRWDAPGRTAAFGRRCAGHNDPENRAPNDAAVFVYVVSVFRFAF